MYGIIVLDRVLIINVKLTCTKRCKRYYNEDVAIIFSKKTLF